MWEKQVKLSFSHMINIYGRELYLNDFYKNVCNTGLPMNWFLGKLYILMPVWMTLTFTQGQRVQES